MVAINIQQFTKDIEKKIIVHGAIVASPSNRAITETKDYTRFVPPTTIPVTQFNEMNLAPVPNMFIEQINPIEPKGNFNKN